MGELATHATHFLRWDVILQTLLGRDQGSQEGKQRHVEKDHCGDFYGSRCIHERGVNTQVDYQKCICKSNHRLRLPWDRYLYIHPPSK